MANQDACGGSNLSDNEIEGEMLNMSAYMTHLSESDRHNNGSREVKIESSLESSNMALTLETDSNNSNNLGLLNQIWTDMIEAEVNTGNTINKSDSMDRTTVRPNINISEQ